MRINQTRQENIILKYIKTKCRNHQVTLNQIMENIKYLKIIMKIDI